MTKSDKQWLAHYVKTSIELGRSKKMIVENGKKHGYIHATISKYYETFKK